MEQSKRPLCNQYQQKVCGSVYVSLISTSLSLSEYVQARAVHCSQTHCSVCQKCEGLLKVAKEVLDKGYCILSQAFRMARPSAKYCAERARGLLLQMPLVSITIGNPSKGRSFSILIEKFPGTDYAKIGTILNGLAMSFTPKESTLEKSVVKMLLSIAQSDRERECVRYAVFKASGMTATAVRRAYGFEKMGARALSVEAALSEVRQIREVIADLASAKDKAMLESFGIQIPDDSSSSDEEIEEETLSLDDLQELSVGCSKSLVSTEIIQPQPGSPHMKPVDLKLVLEQCKHNWFEIIERLHIQGESHPDNEAILSEISQLELDAPSLQLLEQSRLAYLAAENDMYEQQHTARALNGEIVSESESDDPESYVMITDPLSEEGKLLIKKKRAAIHRKMKRQQAKATAERRLLSRKVTKRVSQIIKECPDIGKTIETFVQSCNVGADAWRRTGVLTFDGNVHLKKKATYQRIRLHLQEVYHRKFSYGTVVQLCIPRNKRRMSAKRYQGLAKVTSRRARKGFSLKFNPDAHWSAAFYKGLNDLQYTDGIDLININRDDATGFRLDTLTTCKQYTTPVVQGHEVLTTRTDYVNKYPSNLQTTSYNFTATGTTQEVCAGVVKAPKIHQKSPAQHAADLEFLETVSELAPVFINLKTGLPKAVECVRVDGACDEGPSHEEVQFWWSARHFSKGRVATLVTTRSSGSSYLNRVELQNGCLSLGHASTFIPSTLAGSCLDSETGNVNEEKLRNNLDLAIDAYINRVNGTSCGDTPIHLFKGATDSEQVKDRDDLLIFLKGTKKAKRTLNLNNPEKYSYFQQIWDIRGRHMVSGLPSHYVFMLICCYQPECTHPICRAGKPNRPAQWYIGGPPVTSLPLPAVDPDRPWGSTCESCSGTCSGHYKIVMTDVTDSKAVNATALPPSCILKGEFSKSNRIAVNEAAKKALLSTEDAQIWLDHLQTVVENRKRGAAKAAATRKAKKRQTTVYHCGKCDKVYSSETEECELWIGCDLCDRWYCATCENLTVAPETERYICSICR